MSQCANCSAELEHEYCCWCGQRRIHPEDLSARHFLRELADTVANFPEKLKTVRTFRGLMTPGRLTAEYLAGHRQTYLNPFRFYLVCAAVFFLMAPVAGFTLASMLDSDASGVLRGLVATHVSQSNLDPVLFNRRFDTRVQSILTITFGASALVLALMLQLLFRKRDWPYGAHLVFALHYISLIYLLTVAAGITRVMHLSLDLATTIGYVPLLVYLVLALKRVYAESTGPILLKAGVLIVLTAALNKAASIAAIQLTLALG